MQDVPLTMNYATARGISLELPRHISPTPQIEVDKSKVSMQANLYDELEIDSIDAIDLMVQLKELTGKKIPPEQFKEVRTIGDVLNTLSAL